MRHSGSALLLIQAIVLMLTTQRSTAQVDYTCLASTASLSGSSQTAAIESCLNKANGASTKTCTQSTGSTDKSAGSTNTATEKSQSSFYNCLDAYWSAVTALSKKNSSISTAVSSCLASTGSYASCKLATIVGTSDAKLATKAAQADAKWAGKECPTASATTAAPVKGDSTTTALTTTTTATATATTATATTTAAPTASSTTSLPTPTTTAPVACSTEYCQAKCLFPACNSTVASLATSSFNGTTLTCSTAAAVPTPVMLSNGTLKVSFQWNILCSSTYAHVNYALSSDPPTATGAVDTQGLQLICAPGTGAQFWTYNDVYNVTRVYCLN